ncbi:MAG: hypothetical protein MI723_18795, partial [Caulobacterales bacterium]|nr:hypothetical protein [Caulobacterales bacterium]
ARAMVETVHRTATVYSYFVGLENKGYRWFFNPGAGSGVIPTNDGASCVFASVAPARFHDVFAADPLKGMASIIAAHDPDLAGQLYEAGPQERIRRFGGAPGHLRQCHGPGWALVGDAGYFKDPVTAHGLSDALRDAELLARAVLADREDALAGYQRVRDALSMPLFTVTDALASFDWTLDEAKGLHIRLNEAMKAELEHLLSEPPPARLAA